MWGAADLRRRLGLGEDDETDDATLLELEAAAVAHVQRITNRYFGAVGAHVELMSGQRERAVLRLSSPITTLASVEVLGGAGTLNWQEPWDSSAFSFVVGENVLDLIDGSNFPMGRRNVRVTYTGGYAEGAEPADIREAVVAIVRASYQGQRSAVEAEASNATATASLIVPPVAKAILDSWRRSPGT